MPVLNTTKQVSLSVLQEVFVLQRSLNQIIGRDTVGASQELKDEWLFQYLTASEDELYELAISDDPDNDKIEVIDQLHFNTSLCHILNIVPEDIVNIFDFEAAADLLANDGENTIDDLIACIWRSICRLRRQIEFKWWSKFIKENPDKQFKVIKNREEAVAAVIELYVYNLKLCLLVDMRPADVLKIYKMKHQTNIDRQKNNYDDRNKTEADNLEIIENIRNGN